MSEGKRIKGRSSSPAPPIDERLLSTVEWVRDLHPFIYATLRYILCTSSHFEEKQEQEDSDPFYTVNPHYDVDRKRSCGVPRSKQVGTSAVQQQGNGGQADQAPHKATTIPCDHPPSQHVEFASIEKSEQWQPATESFCPNLPSIVDLQGPPTLAILSHLIQFFPRETFAKLDKPRIRRARTDWRVHIFSQVLCAAVIDRKKLGRVDWRAL